MKFYMVSLGCHKNLVDSEIIISDFEKNGYELTSDESEADAVIIMTCAFIGPAREEARSVISEYVAKKKRRGFKVFVGGCYAKRYSEKLRDEFPESTGGSGSAISTAFRRSLKRPPKATCSPSQKYRKSARPTAEEG